MTAGEWFERLVALQARLRAPNGCPWDREQTHATLRTYLIEEAYEVLDAMKSGDDAKFRVQRLAGLARRVGSQLGLAPELLATRRATQCTSSSPCSCRPDAYGHAFASPDTHTRSWKRESTACGRRGHSSTSVAPA